MKKVIVTVALVVGLGFTQARAQTGQASAVQAENPKEQGVVGRIVDDLKESTRIVHEINKENVAAEKEAFRTRHEEVVEPDPGFEKFRKAKGLKNKTAVVGENIKEGCKESSEKERKRRKQIQSHESYRNLLEDKRGKDDECKD